jgi:hypothetical protein
MICRNVIPSRFVFIDDNLERSAMIHSFVFEGQEAKSALLENLDNKAPRFEALCKLFMKPIKYLIPGNKDFPRLGVG